MSKVRSVFKTFFSCWRKRLRLCLLFT